MQRNTVSPLTSQDTTLPEMWAPGASTAPYQDFAIVETLEIGGRRVSDEMFELDLEEDLATLRKAGVSLEDMEIATACEDVALAHPEWRPLRLTGLYASGLPMTAIEKINKIILDCIYSGVKLVPRYHLERLLERYSSHRRAAIEFLCVIPLPQSSRLLQQTLSPNVGVEVTNAEGCGASLRYSCRLEQAVIAWDEGLPLNHEHAILLSRAYYTDGITLKILHVPKFIETYARFLSAAVHVSRNRNASLQVSSRAAALDFFVRSEFDSWKTAFLQQFRPTQYAYNVVSHPIIGPAFWIWALGIQVDFNWDRLTLPPLPEPKALDGSTLLARSSVVGITAYALTHPVFPEVDELPLLPDPLLERCVVAFTFRAIFSFTATHTNGSLWKQFKNERAGQPDARMYDHMWVSYLGGPHDMSSLSEWSQAIVRAGKPSMDWPMYWYARRLLFISGREKHFRGLPDLSLVDETLHIALREFNAIAYVGDDGFMRSQECAKILKAFDVLLIVQISRSMVFFLAVDREHIENGAVNLPSDLQSSARRVFMANGGYFKMVAQARIDNTYRRFKCLDAPDIRAFYSMDFTVARFFNTVFSHALTASYIALKPPKLTGAKLTEDVGLRILDQ